MVMRDASNGSDRLKSGMAVAAGHALLGYALIAGFAVEASRVAEERLRLFEVSAEPPPPPEPIAPAEKQAAAPEGAASPPNLRSRASPVVAPPPRVKLVVPPPVVAAPVPGLGSDPSAGNADVPGPGTGAGGIGTGTGSGAGGTGSGSGGIASGATLVSGRLKDSDYPGSASRAGAGGTVIAKLSIGADGRVTKCAVHRSSGNAELDATTCRLIERRFRYKPARDAAGRAVPDQVGWKQVWWLEPRA